MHVTASHMFNKKGGLSIKQIDPQLQGAATNDRHAVAAPQKDQNQLQRLMCLLANLVCHVLVQRVCVGSLIKDPFLSKASGSPPPNHGGHALGDFKSPS